MLQTTAFPQDMVDVFVNITPYIVQTDCFAASPPKSFIFADFFDFH